MSGCTVWVSYDVFRKADILIGGIREVTAPGQSIREGIELLLKGNLTIDGDNAGSRTGSVDASVLLAKGFTMLRNNPYEALGLQAGAKTQEIRKAYKKAALLYHPDKNPKTTPLFQAIQLACDKLSDREERIEAEREVERRQRTSVAPVASVNKSYSYQQEPQQKKQNKEKTSSSQTRQEESTPQFKKDNLYERYYSGEPNARYGAEKSQVPSQQDYRQRHNEAVEEVTKRAKYAADAARRCEYEMKARDAAEKRAFDLKVVAMREVAAQKQRDKDAVMKEGQKQYFDEQAKLRLERIAKERAIAEAAMASRRAMYSNIASATPDSSVLPTSYLYKGANLEPTNLRGAKLMSPRTSNVPGFKAPNISVNVKVDTAEGRNNDSASKGVPVTVPLKEGGGVNVQQTSSSCSTYSKPQVTRTRKHVVPIPSEFSCTAVSDSAVELEWKKSTVSNVPVLIQLSWRKQSALAQWQSATRLISGQKCRKNNLDLGSVGGSLYEFRVRAIEDLPGGMLGDRSEWTSIILVGTFKSKQNTATYAPGLPIKEKEKMSKKNIPTKILPQPQVPPVVPTQPQQVFKKSEHLPAAPPQPHRERSPGSTPSFTPVVGVPKAAINSKGSIPVPANPLVPTPPPTALNSYPSYIHRETMPSTARVILAPDPIASTKSCNSVQTGAFRNTQATATSIAAPQPPDTSKVETSPAGLHGRRHSGFHRKAVDTPKNEDSAHVLDDITIGVNMVELSDQEDSEDLISDDDGTNSSNSSRSKVAVVRQSLSKKKNVAQPVTLSRKSSVQSPLLNNSFTRTAWEGMSAGIATKSDGLDNKSAAISKAALSKKMRVRDKMKGKEKEKEKETACLSSDDEYSEDIEEDEESVMKSMSQSFSEMERTEADELIEEEEEKGENFIPDDSRPKPRMHSEGEVPLEKKSPTHRVRIAKKVLRKNKIRINTTNTLPAVESNPSPHIERMWFELRPPKGSGEYEHPVREEPLAGASVRGFLLTGKSVLAQAVVGTWAKVRYHKKAARASAGRSEGWGWCPLVDGKSGHTYLVRFEIDDDEVKDEVGLPEAVQRKEDNTEGVPIIQSNSRKLNNTSFLSAKKTPAAVKTNTLNKIEEWHERYDDEGGYSYYYNVLTGVSSWEAPEWVQEEDLVSKTIYYMQLNVSDGTPLKSTWTKPSIHAKLIRRVQP